MPCPKCSHCKAMGALDAEKQTAAEANEILRAMSERFGYPPSQLTGHDRTQHVAYVRQLCFYLTRETTGMSFPAIGKMYHHDHSSVVHGWQKIARMVLERPAFAQEMARLKPSIEKEREVA